MISAQQYINSLYDGKSLNKQDKERLKEGITWLYSKSGLQIPKVVFAKSLPEAVLCRGYYEYWIDTKITQQKKQHHPLVYINLHKIVDKILGFQTSNFVAGGYYYGNHPDILLIDSDEISHSYRKMKEKAWDIFHSISYKKYLPALPLIAHIVEQQVKQYFLEGMEDALTGVHLIPTASGLLKEVNTKLTNNVVKGMYESIYEGEWLRREICTFALHHQQGHALTDEQRQFMKFFAYPDNIAEVFCYDELCIIVEAPKHILWNSSGQLHGVKEPAISWHDGTEFFLWQDRPISKKFYKTPWNVRAEDILKEHNVEMRRCYREVMGVEYFGRALGLVELDRDFVNEQEVILYRTKEKDMLIGETETFRWRKFAPPEIKMKGEYLYFVKVICHSTRREYFLCVPPQAATNAWGAVAWTFGKTADTYRPKIET